MNRAERKRATRPHQPTTNWRKHASPNSFKEHRHKGWFGEMDRVYSEVESYVVMIRTVETEWGLVEHAAIRNAENNDIPWAEKQRIKNEIFGSERIAIEVFPKESELIDVANMYHIWVLPKGMQLPFKID
ncbi:hypothetical protein [Fictibacillus sp. JL2B1089]|uniref:DUF7694 domain-containing protein n=1 Tax=Fictibacillus sp. JL2B1089 TaxID=3399565 RepID=UPI003A8BE9E1